MEGPVTQGEGRAYVAWVLRIWQVESATGVIWRASLQNARTGERAAFGSVDALCGYLTRRTLPERDGLAERPCVETEGR